MHVNRRVHKRMNKEQMDKPVWICVETIDEYNDGRIYGDQMNAKGIKAVIFAILALDPPTDVWCERCTLSKLPSLKVFW